MDEYQMSVKGYVTRYGTASISGMDCQIPKKDIARRSPAAATGDVDPDTKANTLC